MNETEKINLIKKNTIEVLTDSDLKKLVKNKKISSYYGVSPTGPYHIGYLIPLSKLFDFEKAGIHNKILVADIHAALDDLKTPWDKIGVRGDYYQKCIELSFPWKKKPKFVRGSSFQFKKEYMNDVLKLSTISTVTRATRAASEVTRMKNPKVSELIYPLMQSLDEQYLDVDIQLGGSDQRHIFAYAREYLPKIGYKARVEVMCPLIASLKGPGTKMSASLPETHIKVHDSEDDLKRKIMNAYCPAGEVKDNAIIQLYQYFIFPIKGKVKIERDRKFGGDIVFKDFESLRRDFVTNKIHPLDLKKALSRDIIKMFSRVRKYFEKHEDLLR